MVTDSPEHFRQFPDRRQGSLGRRYQEGQCDRGRRRQLSGRAEGCPHREPDRPGRLLFHRPPARARRARARLPAPVFDFFDGGAEDEITLRDNIDAFLAIGCCRVSCAAYRASTRARCCWAARPVLPRGHYGVRRARWASAGAAAASRWHARPPAWTCPTLSTSATASIEEIADQAPGRLPTSSSQDEARLDALIGRALAAGYEGLMITVDLPVGGKRERNLANGLGFPMKITPRNFWQFMRHPARVVAGGSSSSTGPRSLPKPGGHEEGLRSDRQEVARSVAGTIWVSPRLAALARSRDRWPRQLIKGVVHPADVAPIVALGADALVVSNHGGRQLDTGVATLDALLASSRPRRRAVRCWWMAARGGGGDVAGALALGAAGVLTGRATLYGVLAEGYDGVQRALHILRDELMRTVQLCRTPRRWRTSPRMSSTSRRRGPR